MSDLITPWILLEEEDISPSAWYPLIKQKVQLPSGLVIDDYYLSPLGDVVQVLAITPQNQVVLTRQYKHGLGEILLELPGGMQQRDKTLLQSAIAELEEECGIKSTENDLKFICKFAINPTKLKQVTYGYILFNAEFNSTQKPDITENIEVVTLPAPEVLRMVEEGKIWVTDSMNLILMAARQYPHIFNS
ncbi:NUDIX hydrolase [Olivibacter sp. SDN3]|uniref:NUDIX hydrolase n=1 Tax=Olivibacter sp. SDN3 TaxID=2764720 RepID=UPI00165160EB|nr:NUDIX hydrolase [Olivibacter sp. SDN3]QNL48064.1 NUDIX hydrolase [Olivibacter sp. SDN3]